MHFSVYTAFQSERVLTILNMVMSEMNKKFTYVWIANMVGLQIWTMIYFQCLKN